MKKGRTAPKTRNGGRWTEARFRAFVTTALRGSSMRWQPKYDCIRAAFVRHGINPKTGRKCKLHRCERCGGLFTQSEMRADHIRPVVDPLRGFVDWNTFIERLFVERSGFQAVCGSCHDAKTSAERSIRSKKLTPAQSVRQRSRKNLSSGNP